MYKYLTTFTVITLGFAVIVLSLRIGKIKDELHRRNDELTTFETKLTALKTTLEDVTEDNVAWEDECMNVWEELIEQRDTIEACQNGLNICENYCLCPWTLQPPLPGLEDD